MQRLACGLRILQIDIVINFCVINRRRDRVVTMRNYAAAQPNGEPVEPVEPDEGASLQEEDAARQRSNVANNLFW